jgi:hypothetical protein
MARVKTIRISTPPRASHIPVRMHLVPHSCRTKHVNAPNLGHPMGEDWKVSSGNTEQVLVKKRI